MEFYGGHNRILSNPLILKVCEDNHENSDISKKVIDLQLKRNIEDIYEDSNRFQVHVINVKGIIAQLVI